MGSRADTALFSGCPIWIGRLQLSRGHHLNESCYLQCWVLWAGRCACCHWCSETMHQTGDQNEEICCRIPPIVDGRLG